jgi:four helix bundle protein
MFNFQQLDVYQCASQFLALASPLAELPPRGYASLGEQLRRAALSIALNIAEGSSRFNADERRFYGIARGSALECAAILDSFRILRFASEEDLAEAMELLERVVKMLTRLVLG